MNMAKAELPSERRRKKNSGHLIGVRIFATKNFQASKLALEVNMEVDIADVIQEEEDEGSISNEAHAVAASENSSGKRARLKNGLELRRREAAAYLILVSLSDLLDALTLTLIIDSRLISRSSTTTKQTGPALFEKSTRF